MSLPLNPAPLFSENEYDNNELKKKKDKDRTREPPTPNRNKTIKNHQKTNNIESMIQSLHNSTDDSGSDNLSDYNPLPTPPQSAGVQRAFEKSKENSGDAQCQSQDQIKNQSQPNYNSQ